MSFADCSKGNFALKALSDLRYCVTGQILYDCNSSTVCLRSQ